MKALWIGVPAGLLGVDQVVACGTSPAGRPCFGTAKQLWAPQSVDESSLKVAAHVCRISCEFDTALWEYPAKTLYENEVKASKATDLVSRPARADQ
jgi:hypothetical protein